MPLSPGTKLGQYEIVERIGEGGMGVVYRARDTKLARDVAIKLLHAKVANDTQRLSRFKREAQVLAALNHPHIASIYGLEEVEGVPFLVLELVEGEDLSERLLRVLGEGSNALYVTTGHIVYSYQNSLRAIGFNPVALEPRGNAVSILDDVGGMAVSNDGTLVFMSPLARATKSKSPQSQESA